MTKWNDLTDGQQKALAYAADLHDSGLFFMPSLPQWGICSKLEKMGLMHRVNGVRNEDTGREGQAFELTREGAIVAAQEPGLSFCALPLLPPSSTAPPR